VTTRIKIGAAAFAALLLLLLIFLFARRAESPAAGIGGEGAAPTGARSSSRPAKMQAQLVNVAGGSAGGEEAVSQVDCKMAPCRTQTCNACTSKECATATMGCQALTDSTDRRLCEEVYACFTDPANDCVSKGDPLKCWCGTNPTTCVTDNDPPTQANGVCLKQVFAAAKSSDARTVRLRFMDGKFPLALATILVVCRGEFCAQECGMK
jgi:hypothetical protein